MVLRGAAGSGSHGIEPCAIAQEPDRSFCHSFNCTDLVEEAVRLPVRGAVRSSAVVNQFWYAADAGGDGGHSAGHRFQRREAEGLHLRWHQHQVSKSEQFVEIILLADKSDA